MDMHAYIFIPSTKKYSIVRGSTIENFWYETPGRQSKQFSSRPFKYIQNNNSVVCQILTVAATVKEIEELNAKRRVVVPKLQNSDLDVPSSQVAKEAETDRIRKSRSDLKRIIAHSAAKANSKIIKVHLAKAKETVNDKKNKIPDTDIDADDDLSDDNELQNTKKNNDEESGTSSDAEEHENFEVGNGNFIREPSVSRNEERGSDVEDLRRSPENTERRDNNEQRLHNDMFVRLQEENKTLKSQLSKLRSEKVNADRLARQLHEKFENYKQAVHKEKQDSGKLHVKLKPKGSPTPICCKSQVFVRADALEEAYSKMKPSMFYENMCYLTWGRQILAKRCVKKSRKTPLDCKVLTPKKKRAVRQHFLNYLRFYKYHSVLFNKELNKINDYAHRAITCARKYVRLLEEYPQLGTDEEEEFQVEKVEL